MPTFNILNVLLLAASVSAQRFDGQFWPCNPLKNATGACTPNRGLPTSTYSIDFTKQNSVPDGWTISNYANVNFGSLGAEFTFNKRYDAPQMWTDFSILFGSVSVVARVANGTGMISSAVLISDVFDEIDYEMSGNNFGHREWSAGKGQNNYFGKGITGSYDRGSYFDVSNPQETFHTYTFDWTPTELKWIVDGSVVRTHLASDGDSSTHQYPQTPSKFQLGIWSAGDPSSNAGTRDWAGGYTDMEGGPYTMYVKSVSIKNAMPAWAYNYTDQSGSWRSIALLQEPVLSSSMKPATSSTRTSSKVVKISVSSLPPSTSIKPATTRTTATSKSVSKSGTSIVPIGTTVKLSSPASASSSKVAAITTSKSSSTTIPPSSTFKPSKAIPYPKTTSKATTTCTSTLTDVQPPSSPTSCSTKRPAGTSRSSRIAIPEISTANKAVTAASKTVLGKQMSPVGSAKLVKSYTSTTKCSTTSTTPKPPAHMEAATSTEIDWAWGGWSNQYHGNRKGPKGGRHCHTHTRRH